MRRCGAKWWQSRAVSLCSSAVSLTRYSNCNVITLLLIKQDPATRLTIAEIFVELSAQNGAPAQLRAAHIVSPLLEALFADTTPPLRRALVLCLCRLASDSAAAEEMSNAGALLALTGKFDPRSPDSDVTLNAIEALLRYPQARSGVVSDSAFAALTGMHTPHAHTQPYTHNYTHTTRPQVYTFTTCPPAVSLSSGSPAVQDIALRIISTLAADAHFSANAEKAGIFLALLPFVSRDVRALQVLQAIVTSYPAARGALTRAGLLPPLVQQLSSQV